MRAALRRTAVTAAAPVTIIRSHGGASHDGRCKMGRLARRWLARRCWHGGGWHVGGWRSGGWGWGFAPGFALGLGLGAAPYYAYGGPYYGAYAYGDCVMRRRVVINRWGHRVWRWARVCY